SSESGAPVEAIAFICFKLYRSLGFTPNCFDANKNGGLVPNTLIFVSSANSQITSGLGDVGLPSYNTTVAPNNNPLTNIFQIIQPVVVNQKSLSPSFTFICRASAL